MKIMKTPSLGMSPVVRLSKISVCETCHCSFANQEQLTKHLPVHFDIPINMKPVVEMKRVFVCVTCYSHFDSQTNLDDHSQTHYNNADRVDTTSDNNNVEMVPERDHVEMAHNIQLAHAMLPVVRISRLLCCSICNLSFTNADDLTRHAELHRADQVVVINEDDDLRLTVRLPRLFFCRICDAAFTEDRRLIEHSELHMDNHRQ